MTDFTLHRLRQAAIQRLNQHIGSMALVDYEETRDEINRARTEDEVREALRNATGEEIKA